MGKLAARWALLPEGWAEDVEISVGEDGRIEAVASGCRRAGGRAATRILLPAPSNVHSHAFQRAMAGLTEWRGPEGRDNFWTWRALMHRFLEQLTPDDIEAIAALAFLEMLEAGYAAIGEFHYVHTAPGGVPYADRAELSRRIMAAAADVGIGLTLLPVLYTRMGVDGRALESGARRFGLDRDGFAGLIEDCEAALAGMPGDWVLGVAPHSLRSVTADELAFCAGLRPPAPLHIHAAEQVKEVTDVVSAYGATPVAWLMANHDVGERWCLIHATQMTPAETAALARSGAVAGLCPITEANLGDGIFDGVAYLAEGGRIGIGSDSNVRIALGEELRALEYSQRLRDRSRAALVAPGASVGRTLYQAALAGGAQALGRDSGQIAQGQWADLVGLDGDHPALAHLTGDRVLDAWIFAADDGVVGDVWSAGRHVVAAGRHSRRPAVEARFRAVMRRLDTSL